MPPKLVPVIVICVPAGADVGERLVMLGAGTTVKLTPLLTRFDTVTTTFPVVAPLGTGATIDVALQLVGVVRVPLNATVLVPCVVPKFAPAMVTCAVTGARLGLKLVMLGDGMTVNAAPLLAKPPTLTTTLPEVEPFGTGTTMVVAVQDVGLPAVPLKLTVLVPCVVPK